MVISVTQPLRDIRNLVGYFSFRWAMRNSSISIPETPIFAAEDDKWFRNQLSQARFYLEFGSGSSTLLAARANVKCIAVESDPNFADTLMRALPVDHNVTLVAVQIGLTGAWGYPVFKKPTDHRVARWNRYTATALEELGKLEEFPDFVLIDGRFRLACALATAAAAAQRKADTTIMFDDYVGRPHYHKIEQFLGAPILLERAAIFKIKGGQINAPIEPQKIYDSHQDFR